MDLFIYATIGILGIMFLFIGYAGGFKRIGIVLSAFGVVSMALIGFVMYSGEVLYSGLISSSTGAQLATYQSDLAANNHNGIVALVLLAGLVVFGFILHFWDRLHIKKGVAINE